MGAHTAGAAMIFDRLETGCLAGHVGDQRHPRGSVTSIAEAEIKRPAAKFCRSCRSVLRSLHAKGLRRRAALTSAK